MNIDLNNAVNKQPVSEQNPKPAQKMANGDFETFLKMLTTQIRNQDPMKPMESSDFAVQLATFSGVEQQVQTNQLLQAMAGAGGAMDLSTYADWIGKEARTTAPVYFNQQPVTLDIQPDPQADEVILVTMDSYGRDLTREQIGTGAGQVGWAGRDAMGNSLPKGLYSFRIENMKEGEQISTKPVGAYATIQEAEWNGSGITLIMTGGASATPDEITALRDRNG